jgi:glyoxylase-like metal-dependent hydrolase (beta-lactamase superfamily II)
MKRFILVMLASYGALARESPFNIISREAERSDVTVHRLRGNVHLLEGSGGNICVLANRRAALMVDAGIAVSKEKIRSALDSIAHPNTTRHMSSATTVAEWDHTFPPWPADARPTVAVESTKTMRLGDETVVISYLGPSHTDGDLSIYFTKADILALGDVWWNGFFPFIDKSHGGSIDGTIRATNESITKVGDRTLIVPGHGAPGGRAELIEYRDMLVEVRDNVARLKNDGRSLEEVIASKPTAPYDDKWGKGVIDPAFFTEIVYSSLP